MKGNDAHGAISAVGSQDLRSGLGPKGLSP